jgi:hypothetical protein
LHQLWHEHQKEVSTPQRAQFWIRNLYLSRGISNYIDLSIKISVFIIISKRAGFNHVRLGLTRPKITRGWCLKLGSKQPKFKGMLQRFWR